jgi:toxin FitB
MTASDPILIDSSGWMHYLTAGAKADLYLPYFTGDSSLLVPTIVVYEVRKVLLHKHSQTAADLFVSEALRRTVVPFDEQLALSSASVSMQYQLPMADAIVYATALLHGATLIVSDQHFQNLPGVLIL